MRTLRPLALLAALAAAVAVAPAVQAETVLFGTDGVFTSSGTSTLDLGNGNSISFNGQGFNTANPNPFTFATFGQFDTSGFTTDIETPVTTGFELTIGQLAPTFGEAQFIGTIAGNLTVSSSGVVLTFTSPLAVMIGNIKYEILSSDLGAGTLVLSPPEINNGLTSINARITAIPEPSAFILMGLAAPAAFLYRRRTATVA
ncbi:PEP-CTERM sorting domain-containing protein [Planctomyces sp. SH-PL62]|uniref:PEP-CTERM sorting domain-containing protein n=1 Tax=Planctomyces sp. SH-PL62 TaxID=1636152 RepID=UPI00078EEAEF|nr:PEP-CTERM sorting domain-containing protein [Planctomyces sp. SH-PL62]AMV40419.1 hypothetical protein VT85_23510 [Planctomyces sp. SH-PL62]